MNIDSVSNGALPGSVFLVAVALTWNKEKDFHCCV
jgi:hypothetical protein